MDRTLSQKKFFDAQAEGYESLYGEKSRYERGIVEARKRIIRSTADSSLSLDLGAGTGTYLAEICRKAGFVVALDISPKMLAKARERAAGSGSSGSGSLANAAFVIADAQNLPFRPSVFGSVYCINTFYHVPNRSLVLEEIRRVLKPRSFALVEFYSILNPFVFVRVLFNPLARHGFVYAEFIPLFLRALKSLGFSIRKIHTLSRAETSEAVRHWLPAPLFLALQKYQKLSQHRKFLRLPRMRCVAEVVKG